MATERRNLARINSNPIDGLYWWPRLLLCFAFSRLSNLRVGSLLPAADYLDPLDLANMTTARSVEHTYNNLRAGERRTSSGHLFDQRPQ